MKKSIYILLVLVMTVGFVACNEEETVKREPIFAGVGKITLFYNGGSEIGTGNVKFSDIIFQFPDKNVVSYVVMGFFNNPIIVDTTLNKITNTTDWVFGSRTNLAGFSTDTASTAYVYSQTTQDFTSAQYSTPGTFYWAVWAYDEFGNLIAASPEMTNYITF